MQNKPLQTCTVTTFSPPQSNRTVRCSGMTFKRRGSSLTQRKSKTPAVAKNPAHVHAEARDLADAPPTTSEGDVESSGQVYWAYHPCQRDDANQFAPLSSAVVRANTQDRLMEGRGVYREGFEMVTRMNPGVAEVVRRHTMSTCNQGRYERSRSLFGYKTTRTPPVRRRMQQWQARRGPRRLGERFGVRCDGHRTMRVLPSSSCA